MNNQNNQDIPANQHAQESNLPYLAHDLDRPIRSYALPNLYDFNPGIAYPTFGENIRFEIKPVILQVIQNAGQFGGHPMRLTNATTSNGARQSDALVDKSCWRECQTKEKKEVFTASMQLFRAINDAWSPVNIISHI